MEARPAYHRQTPIQTRAAEPWTLLMAPAKATLLNFGIWIGIGTILAAVAHMSPLLFVLIPMAVQPVLILLQFRDPHYMTATRAWFSVRQIRARGNEIDAVAGRVHLA
ncbi:hypothetical protein [Roseiterribacter gracilis]|uniref:Uncharacterized protein n=1 Tax=Roseiterribacter gracilis TaxID=2812848 RepID=A0A8S8XHI5_9PROT|nr:hypothetical protein TMPK1_36690 [Rhodospirillales bacterium TMPK1]